MAFGVSKTESYRAYKCLLQSALDTIKILSPEFDPKPTFAMADFAPSIHKALKDFMPEGTFLHCRFHFWQLVNTKLRSLKLFPKSIRNCSNIPAKFKTYFNFKSISKRAKKYDVRRVIRYDICILSKLPTLQLFNIYWKIITPFWKYYVKDFYQLFKTEYIDNVSKNGWRNCVSLQNPKTNNQIEGYNKALKEVVKNKQMTAFNDYLNLLIKELESKSVEASKIPKFSNSPSVPPEFFQLANVLAKNFDDLFLELRGYYYVKDISINVSLHSKDRKKLCTTLKSKLSKILSGAETEIFTSRFSKPQVREVEFYLQRNISLKQVFISIAKIRQIEVKERVEGVSALSLVKCTCPDFSLSYYCVHSLATLIQKNYLQVEEIPSNEIRGRRMIDEFALEEDEVSCDDEAENNNDENLLD